MESGKREVQRSKLLSRVSWGLFGLLWMYAIAIGFRMMWTYELTPGVETSAPIDWPTASTIPPSTKQATLLVFAHPHCPCTRASLSELSVLLSSVYGQLDAYVLFLTPATQERAWTGTDLRHLATSIPGVQVVKDTDGREVRLFGSTTSGHVLLYDTDGHLRFSGGITANWTHIRERVTSGDMC
jgi:hypothetical protein